MRTIYKCCHCRTELENQCWCPTCLVEVEDYDEEIVSTYNMDPDDVDEYDSYDDDDEF